MDRAAPVKLTNTTTAFPTLRRLAAALLLLMSSAACPKDGVLSVHPIVSPSLASVTLDRDLLRAVFTMRMRHWPDGSQIRVFVLPDDDPVSDHFYRERLGMYSYVLRRAWDRMVFTGTGLAPTIVQSEREMIERVRATPGAIGYARQRKLSESDPVSLPASSLLPTKAAND